MCCLYFCGWCFFVYLGCKLLSKLKSSYLFALSQFLNENKDEFQHLQSFTLSFRGVNHSFVNKLSGLFFSVKMIVL